MAEAKQMILQEGDWVGGTSPMDEMFIGFVQALSGGEVEVWVTQSDSEKLAGTVLEIRQSRVKRLPDQAPKAPEELRVLVELALMTHDREWFDELCATSASSPLPDGFRPASRSGFDATNPRLSGIAPCDRTDA